MDLRQKLCYVLEKLENTKDKFGIPTSYNISARVFFYSNNHSLRIIFKSG